MKKIFFFLAYLCTPLVPIVMYLNGAGFSFDSYTFSVILGILSYIFICNQFLLAARPSLAVKALGTKALMSFHGTMPIIILLLAVFHRILKGLNGFSLETLQANFGAVALIIFAGVILFTVLLMANTFVLKSNVIKKFRAFIYKKTGLTYKGSRLLHNATVLGGLLLLLHVYLASSFDFTVNPVGLIYMFVWMLFSLGLYFSYRLKGRTVKGK